MRRSVVIAALALGLSAAPASALEIKNLRPTFGPFGGPGASSKLLPGDILFLAFDIEDLKMEPQTGLVRYLIRLEVIDDKGKVAFKRDTPNQRYLALGNSRVADRAQVITGTDQDPGKYTVKLTVQDQSLKELPIKEVSFPFEILKGDFGLIHAVSPSVAVTNQDFTAHVALTGMGRDAKMMPNVEVRVRILDDKGKPTLPKPSVVSIPKDLPEEIDVKKQSIVPLPFPIYLNRPGRFTIEIEAEDLLGKKTARVTFPLLVLEPSITGN